MPKPINISASRGAAILGLSGYQSQVDIWLQIMESREPGFCERNNYKLPEFVYNSAMKWGHAFESAIVELAEGKQNCKIINRELPSKHEIHNFITCHQDGEYENDDEDIHEGKTTSYFYYKDNFGTPGTDKVPIEYQVQGQHLLLARKRKRCILSVLVFPKRVEEWEEMGIEIKLLEKYTMKINGNLLRPIRWAHILDEMGYFHQYEINAHEQNQKKMIEKYTTFWNENVIGAKQPEPSNIDDIKKLFRDPVGTIVATDEIERYNVEEKMINDEIKELTKKKEQLKKLQLEYLHENSKINNFVVDDESQDKIILRDSAGIKLHSYSKNKNGDLVFR